LSKAQEKVKLKLVIKGSPHYKLEYNGTLDEATKMVIHNMAELRKQVFNDDEYVEKLTK